MTVAVLAILAAIAWTDATRHQIPDEGIRLLMLCGLVHALLDALGGGEPSTWAAGLLICWLPPLLLFLSLKRDFIGGGDIKLCAALGWLLGPVDGPLVMMAALAGMSSYALITHNEDKLIPFAPFIFLAYLALTIFL